MMREREDKTVTTQRDADRRIGDRISDEVRQLFNFFKLYTELLAS